MTRSRLVPALVLAVLVCACAPDEPPPVLGRAPEFALTNQASRSFSSDELAGRPWVASFVFTRCGSTCPIQTTRMAGLQERLAADPELADVRLVSFSVDPEFDTPEVLTDYAEHFRADPERWSFLTGSRAELWRISKDGFKLGVESDPDGTMPIVHSTRFVVVDREGQIRGYPDGLTEDGVDEVERMLRALL